MRFTNCATRLPPITLWIVRQMICLRCDVCRRVGGRAGAHSHTGKGDIGCAMRLRSRRLSAFRHEAQRSGRRSLRSERERKRSLPLHICSGKCRECFTRCHAPAGRPLSSRAMLSAVAVRSRADADVMSHKSSEDGWDRIGAALEMSRHYRRYRCYRC